jgi:AraC-like DNA-binding protein
MSLITEERDSDSAFVERIWRAESERIDHFMSIASNRWEIVVWRQAGETYIDLRGPETKATTAAVPENAEFFGILLKPGTFMPHIAVASMVDGGISLPTATNRSFWLHGAAWEIPTFDNADTFANRLVRAGVIAREPTVEAVLRGEVAYLSARSVQRRFLRATGLTYIAMRQVERARQAAYLLRQGVPILDTVYATGYFDQPHMTRALKQLIGQTPAQLMDQHRLQELSYLYNPALPLLNYDELIESERIRGAAS